MYVRFEFRVVIST